MPQNICWIDLKITKKKKANGDPFLLVQLAHVRSLVEQNTDTIFGQLVHQFWVKMSMHLGPQSLDDYGKQASYQELRISLLASIF
jgi:hypothetical protein